MNLKINDILIDKEIKDFLRAKPRRESTEMEHIKRIRSYCNFIGKKPVELIKEAEDEEENRTRMKKRRIRNYFIEYSEYLRNQQLSQYTISNQFSTIKSFYRNAEIELPNIEINSRSEGKRARNESIPSKDDIRKALKHCTFKYQAIVLLMSSSGMGSGEIRNLTFGDFLDAIRDFIDYEEMDIVKISAMLDSKENIVGSWNVHRQKQGNSYYTFSSPESIKAITDYLIERQKRDSIIKSKDRYLFENFGKKISEHSFTKNFQRINDDEGFGLSGRQRYFRSHALRKYFASTLHKNGLSQINIDWLLGHEISGVNASYIKADSSKLKEEYLKVVEDLSIEKVKVQMVTTEGYDNLINKLSHRDEVVNKLKEQLNQQSEEFMALNDRINDIEEIDIQLMEIDVQIPDVQMPGGNYNKLKELLEQKKTLNQKKVELMSQNNPRLSQLHHEMELKRAQNLIDTRKRSLKKAKSDEEKNRCLRLIQSAEDKLRELNQASK